MKLAKPWGAITRKDLASLEVLSTYKNTISDLAGLEYATNLSMLSLKKWVLTRERVSWNPLCLVLGNYQNSYSNQITDVTPLANLTKLTVLILEGNKFTNITPLTGLTNLTELLHMGNQIIYFQKRLPKRALPNCEITF